LPHIDAVVISHDHYDHLDMDTVVAMADLGARFIVPLGIGAHLTYWGIPEERIQELDWWQEAHVADLGITATPARHASGRIHPQGDQTLWAGYAFVGPSHRVFYSGDTGFHATLADIGERLGPFDVTLVESGQYNPTWPDWHLGPEQAVALHLAVRGGVMIPVHWGLFTLAPHGWTEPVERVLAAARCRGVAVLTPRPGESIEPLVAPASERWWPSVPWHTAEQTPIVASRAGDRGDLFPLPACAAP
jgi:L-ascorbate metabolism protein UlaG (beta-lactamase superfamily)